VSNFDELADQISGVESRLSDLIFDAVRSQLRGEQPEEAKELEKRLSKARRSLQKAEHLLRGIPDVED